MKKTFAILSIVIVAMTTTSCSGNFWEGMAAGMGSMGTMSSSFYGGSNPMFNNFWDGVNLNTVSTASTGSYSGGSSTRSSSSYSSTSSSSTSSTRKCNLCHGSGKCNTCNGTGTMWNSYGLGKQECPNCRSHKGRCSGCGGTGTR